MDTMKQTGIQWIGEIPSDWNTKRIKYMANLKGRIGWQGLTSDEYQDEGAYLITGVDFADGGIDWENCVHIPMKRWEEAKDIQIQNGDLLITKDGTIGKVAIVSDMPGETSLNSGVLRIMPIEGYSRRFLYWVIKSDEFWNWFNFRNAGNSTIIHLYQGDFAEFLYAFPDYDEQEAIADFLDEHCGKLDGIISDLAKEIETLKTFKKSLITETVTKGVDKNMDMKDSNIDWIGSIPKQSKITRLKYVIDIKDGTHDTPDYVEEQENSVPLITPRFLDYETRSIMYDNAYHISSTDAKNINLRSNVEFNDIIMPMIGTIGNPVIVKETRPFSIKNVALFKTNSDEILASYIFYMFESRIVDEQFKQLAQGGVQSFVSLTILGNIKIVIHDRDFMERIVIFLNEQCLKIDDLILKKKTQLQTIEAAKSALVFEYVTGKKRIKEVQ